MKRQWSRSQKLAAVAMGLALLVGAGFAVGQSTASPALPAGAGGMGGMSGSMGSGNGHPMMSGEQMQAHMRQMTQRYEEMDSRLNGLVEKMDRARGNARIEAIEAVVRELAAQRQTLRGMDRQMQAAMMQQMAQHMGAGMMTGMQQGISGWPMMQGMDGGTSGHMMHH
jgi:hypothetical protein